MKRKKGLRDAKIELEAPKARYVPDPHRRHNIIPNKKHYNRKVQSKAGPSDFFGTLFAF